VKEFLSDVFFSADLDKDMMVEYWEFLLLYKNIEVIINFI
jgi:hypothetical protein